MNITASEHHRIRNAILVALFLLGAGTLAYLYRHANLPLGQNRFMAWAVHRLEIPAASLPAWFPGKKAVPISEERNARVLKSVFEVFDPSLRAFLASVPIVLDSSAHTAKAYPAKGCITVSPDWDKTVLQSPYRAIYEQRGMKPEDPVFMNHFKTDLLIHEFLHILQVHQGIDSRLCYEAVARWYADPRYGVPSPAGMVSAGTTKAGRPDTLVLNRMKYIVWHELYNYRMLSTVPQDESWKDMQYVQRYRSAKRGVEEFAYIGQEILASGSSSENYMKTGQWSDRDWESKKLRLVEVSPEVIAVYRGLFNPALYR